MDEFMWRQSGNELSSMLGFFSLDFAITKLASSNELELLIPTSGLPHILTLFNQTPAGGNIQVCQTNIIDQHQKDSSEDGPRS